MIIVGLTGGIGSGKTTVAGFFNELEIPVYIADIEAKKLMNKSKVLQKKIKKLFGEKAYKNDELNRPFIASKIFEDKLLLQKMNAIVHPKVAKHFLKWAKKQDAEYIIKEVAVLFENGSYKSCDYIITVTADKSSRIKRVIKRDNATKSNVKNIIKNQWSDADKVELSNFVIKNKDLEYTKKQVVKIHNQILKAIKKP